jgi:predicted metal-dependent HD superfamily phosphohydrolase
LAKNLFYHGPHHTEDVLNAVEKIAFNEKVSPEDFILLRAAVLFHDFGYIDKYLDNEIIGADYAREILPKYGFSPSQIIKICDLIISTKVPQKPNNHLERIICDADLDYLGRKDFLSISSNFYRELKEYGMVKNKNHWDEIQIKFLRAHHFFTEHSINNRSILKKKHLEFIKSRVSKNK